MSDARTSQNCAEAPTIVEHLLIMMPPGLFADLDMLKNDFPDMKITVMDPRQGLPSKEILKTVTIYATVRLMPDIEDVPNLKMVHILAAGFDPVVNHPIFKESDAIITSVAGIHGPSMAEWVIMNWVNHSRKYHLSYEQQKSHVWGSHAQWADAYDYAGKTVGIVGYGSIGRHIGRVATAMGMKVLAYTFSPRDTPESKKDRGYIIPHTGDPDGTIPAAWFSGKTKEELHHFLAQGLDQVVVSVPLTPATTKMFGAEEFKVLSKSTKPGHLAPYFCNISRGPVIDQDALAKSLEAGELRGAAIDVAVPEPLPSDHPLWDTPNLVITPHISSIGKEYMERSLDILRTNLHRMKTGEPLLNQYNRDRGY